MMQDPSLGTTGEGSEWIGGVISTHTSLTFHTHEICSNTGGKSGLTRKL